MKKGDVVIIDDGSYTKSVVNGKLVHEHLAFDAEAGRRYVVVEINCTFPAEGNQALEYSFSLASFNNTVIQAIDSGKVVFIEERFLRLVESTHKVMIDIEQDGCAVSGMVREISDELYKQIKK